MGWLWSSSKPQEQAAPAQQTPQQQQPPSPPASQPPNASESDDAEIQKFFEMIKSEETSSSPSTAPQPSTSFLSRFRSSESDLPPAPRRDPLSESLLPTEMSCRQAFDLAWSCNSIGGQWNGVYRYGGMRSCSEQWNDFWFCMRTKSSSGPVKDELVRSHYRNKEHAKYYAAEKHNSEEVWEAREQKVAPGSVMAGFVAPDMNDEEWRDMEKERRQKIRDSLGFDKDRSRS